MDFQDLFNATFALISIFVGWYLRAVWDAISRLRLDIQQIERNIPNVYLRRDDFQIALADIKDTLNRIEDKLDNKADK
jgi:hypothetical protein